MKKQTNLNIAVLIILVFNSAISQNDIIYPKHGEIVFEKQAIIYDTAVFNISKKEFGNKFIMALKKSLIRDQALSGKVSDSIEEENRLNLMKDNIGSILFDEVYHSQKEVEHFKYKDSLIVSYKTKDGFVTDNYRIINQNRQTFYYLAKTDSVTRIYQRNFPYKYNQTKINIKEYRNETKIIDQFECFKIVCTTEEVLDELLTIRQSYTMYVTEQIKSDYHPIVYFKSVLDKYYPLEIIQKDEDIKAAEVQYRLIHLQL